ncbi:MAG: glycosyltransferase family 4 protein [Bacteroidota bacterium]
MLLSLDHQYFNRAQGAFLRKSPKKRNNSLKNRQQISKFWNPKRKIDLRTGSYTISGDFDHNLSGADVIKNKRKVGFIKYAGFSHANSSLLDVLKLEFPNLEFVVIALEDLISKNDFLALVNCYMLYGRKIKLDREKISRYYFRTPYMFQKIRKVLQAKYESSDFIFTFQTQSFFDGSLSGIPHFVYTDHTHLENLRYPDFDVSNLFHRKWIALEQSVYANAALNFAMSTNIATSMIKDYGLEEDQVLTVGCGSNVRVSQNVSIPKSKYKDQNILFAGVDWERKGGSVLVEAFKIVQQTFKDATLTIVGTAPKIPLRNCEVVGKVPLSEMEAYYQKASLFVLPTNLEPFGFVFLEAMASKTPVIGTNIGALPDLIHDGKNGYLVSPKDVEQLATAIKCCLANPEKMTAFGAYGHQLFWNQYNWEVTGKKIKMAILEQMDVL